MLVGCPGGCAWVSSLPRVPSQAAANPRPLHPACSTLAGLADERVRALFLIDPVDVTVYAPMGPDYPSACEGLAALGKQGRALPLAVVGGGLGGDCVPSGSNYETYFSAATAPAWEVVIRDAGHFQFIDSRGGVMDAICAVGRGPDASVAALTQAAMVAWAETMVRGDPIHVGGSSGGGGGGSSGGGRRRGDGTRGAAAAAPVQAPPRLRMGLDSDGNITAGLASWDAASRLFSTSQQARQLLERSAGSSGAPLEFCTRLKNFSFGAEP